MNNPCICEKRNEYSSLHSDSDVELAIKFFLTSLQKQWLHIDTYFGISDVSQIPHAPPFENSFGVTAHCDCANLFSLNIYEPGRDIRGEVIIKNVSR